LRDILPEVEHMQIKYSPDADVLMVKLGTGIPVDSIDVAEGLIAHYSQDKKLLEIEILDASQIVEMKDLILSGLEMSPV